MDAGLLPALSLGFLFGLQHATDSDHVVAVATIGSRTRRFDAGALIGAFWGIGHTATIAAVGMAIIVFNVTVTPSIGLTMELAVALMLMGLGIFRVVRAVRERGEAPHPAPRATHGLRSVLETVGRAQVAAQPVRRARRTGCAASWRRWDGPRRRARWASGSSMGWPAAPPWPSSSSRRCGARSPLSPTSPSSGSAPSWG